MLGRQLLAEADVVVDRQARAPRRCWPSSIPDVEIIDAGKAPHAHNLTQEQINELIVDRALAGQRVVRLKGGDPFVFGRGGEEALACVRAGVPFQVVPGVTSAVAVPAYAGHPGHPPRHHPGLRGGVRAPGPLASWRDRRLGRAGARPGTLVLLMAVAHLDSVAAELIKRGRDAATPVAVICDGTTPGQQVLTSTLGEVAADAAAAGIRPPAVVVVGEVVRLRDLLGDRVAGAAA